MKALVFDEHGAADVLRYADIEQPQPRDGELVVALKAMALNHLDIWVRRGWPGLELSLPHIGGADGVGVVSAVGEGVDASVRLGTRVAICPGFATAEDEFTRRGQDPLSPSFRILGEHRPGTFAECVVVPAEALLPMPEEAEFDQTAAAQLVFLTAWRMLITQAGLRAGESVLVVGAGGGVNSAALQIAKLAGAQVIAVTSSPDKVQRASQLGADHVIDRTSSDWAKEVRQLTGKRGVDVVVDNVGHATFQKSISVLCRGGRLVTVGNTSGPKAEIDIRHIFFKQLHIIGSTMGTPQEFRDVMTSIWSGRLQPVIDCVMPLSQGAEAHRRLESGEQFGKIVLRPDSDE